MLIFTLPGSSVLTVLIELGTVADTGVTGAAVTATDRLVSAANKREEK